MRTKKVLIHGTNLLPHKNGRRSQRAVGGQTRTSGKKVRPHRTTRPTIWSEEARTRSQLQFPAEGTKQTKLSFQNRNRKWHSNRKSTKFRNSFRSIAEVLAPTMHATLTPPRRTCSEFAPSTRPGPRSGLPIGRLPPWPHPLQS